MSSGYGALGLLGIHYVDLALGLRLGSDFLQVIPFLLRHGGFFWARSYHAAGVPGPPSSELRSFTEWRYRLAFFQDEKR